MVENPGICTAAHVAAVADTAGETVATIPQNRTRYADTQGIVGASSAAGLRDWVRSVADEVELPFTAADAGRWADLATECRRPDSGVLEAACTSGRVPVATGAVLGKELRAVRSQVSGELWDACADALTGYAAGGATPKQLHQAVDIVLTQYGDSDWIETRTGKPTPGERSLRSLRTVTAPTPRSSPLMGTQSPRSNPC